MRTLTEIQASLRAEETALRSLCEDLRGRRLAVVRYYGQAGTELDVWMRDHGDAHELDFGVELGFSGGALVHATWDGPPSYHLRLRSGPLWPPVEEPGAVHDVAGMAPWANLIGATIDEVRISRSLFRIDLESGPSRRVDAPVDAEFVLRGGGAFFVCCRRVDQSLPLRASHDTDHILVVFSRAAAAEMINQV